MIIVIYLRYLFIAVYVQVISGCDSPSNYVERSLPPRPSEEITSSDIGSSLRIGTYNAQFLVFPEESGGCCADMSVQQRIRHLSNRILASNYDIIVLQEGFDDELQEELVRLMRDRYPFFVQYLDGDSLHNEFDEETLDAFLAGDALLARTTTYTASFPPCGLLGFDACSDSGLMLFSRFPFIALPEPKSTIVDPEDVIAVNGPANWRDVGALDWKDVGFHEFVACENERGSDCNANKGVALIRIRHPDGTIYNMVFTHLDAGTSTLAAKTRQVQLREIKGFIETTLGRSLDTPTTEQTIFVGDFNIDGDVRKPERSTVTENEWEKLFGPGGSDTLHGSLWDSWEFEKYDFAIMPQALRDRGLTASSMNPNKRIDYIMRNRAPHPLVNAPLCVQHTALAYNLYQFRPATETAFGLAGSRPLSDHIGVNMDLNLAAPRCSSAVAREITADDFDSAFGTISFDDLDTGLKHPGSTQWYVLTASGTYSIFLDGDEGLGYHIYRSTDLTRPLRSYMGLRTAFRIDSNTSVEGETYKSPEEPLYIKVFHKDRTWRGNYSIHVHMHRCASPDDFCTLYPNIESEEFVFPSGPSAGMGDRLFFRIDTDAPLANVAQSQVFQVDHDVGTGRIAPSNLYELELFDSGWSALVASSGILAQIQTEDSNLNRKMLGLTVRKRQPGAPNRIHVFWNTNLRILQLIGLQAVEETDDGFGEGVDDDIKLQLIVNGTTAYDSDLRPRLGDFDEDGGYRGLAPWIRCPVGYVLRPAAGSPQAVISLEEADPGRNDFLTGVFPSALAREDILQLDERDGEGGKYQLQFSQSVHTHLLNFTSGLSTNGRIDCEEKQPFDEDGDGISNAVDLDIYSVSSAFADTGIVGLDGNTLGSIEDRAGRDWLIRDEPDDPNTPDVEGLHIAVSPGSEEGKIRLTSTTDSPCSLTDISVPPSTTESVFIATCR